MKILIVDDRADCLQDLANILQTGEYEIVSAANGLEALDIVKSETIDLIISDILMPGMDGYALCRTLKRDESLKHIPFIIYTATYTGEQDQDLAMRSGANAYILKPCEPQKLLETISRLVMESPGAGGKELEKPSDNQEVLELYNQRLVRKLEQKMLELEAEVKEHKNTLEALQLSESLLKNTQEIGKLGGWTLDMRSKNMYWTDEMYRIHDLEPGTCTMETLYNVTLEYVEEAQREKLKALKDELLSVGTPFQFESWFITPKGNNKYIRFNAQAKQEAGVVTRVQGILQDLSEQKYAQEEQEELEAQLRQAQKLESIGQLAGGVAHDFNNVLTVILGYAEEIMNKLLPQDPIYHDIQEILNAGARASTLARQLLTFSRKQSINPQYISINEIVQNLSKMLLRILSESIEIILDLEETPGLIYADVVQMEQVIVNLAINARDAMPEGGKLKIESFRIDATPAFLAQHPSIKAGSYVALKISDTGQGIPREHLSQVFEPFFTTKERGHGTGLGLPTVYGIIRQANGYLTINSEIGVGTNFIILLPLAEGKTKSGEKTAAPASRALKDELILILEDDPTICDLTARMAAKSGYRVSTANRADKALQLIFEDGLKPDLVIADVVMPGMNGLEFASVLHKKRPEIKILLMSGYAESVLDKIGTRNPDFPFLQKPFTRKELLISIRTALDS
ncbi:MAG: response regulator [Candidatus Cloacimonetes bacterium]|nr:response regulator [Candidatus Cloacimonadota bacterium]